MSRPWPKKISMKGGYKWKNGLPTTPSIKKMRAAVNVAVNKKLNARTGGFLGIEQKYHDSTLAETVIGTSLASGERDPATANCLNGIAQGDTETTRDGKNYLIKSVHVNGYISRIVDPDNADPPTYNIGFVALVLDTQSNGAQLNSEDVYQGTLGATPFRDLQYSASFKVLGFKQFTFDCPNVATDGTNTNSSGGQVVPFRFDVNKDIKVHCTGTGTTVSDIQDNSLHIIASAYGAGTANAYIQYNARVRFVG